ncbi:FeoC-like transcriptional regulator [Vibrio parahaemolyticus]|uniref:FeoC-like transcriptional regulator n=1 Tax=Vibrio parahaemolyticus TaxID=670 RepID=UPI0010D6F9D6|nr:FeoC-like transcriptional regulator [Vibrio parahaemolyticus]EJG0041272.1 iron transporter FeoC [Vibrio parahaemolyticus]MBE4432697.1 iron transporter FeoC [Vibrio parahaemolyticus]MDF4812188.1 FeoC-like transcriptional regulator [Vibrio parahaemolyticus]MDF4827079.1 FeoC-like transcriptional regulator [Vibrio parahaemolyticus]MDF4831824.1 FeoC-like transcriptional regulator [Vibrio parahaemolyticus]
MILNELYQYIADKGTVSQSELAKQFGMSEDGADAMLSVWIKKGKISRLVDTNKDRDVMRVRYAVTKQDELSLTVTM